MVLQLRSLLNIPVGQKLVLERYSDSAAKFIPLDDSNPSAYKQLYRAAKAKLKLRIRAHIPTDEAPASLIPELAEPSLTATMPVPDAAVSGRLERPLSAVIRPSTQATTVSISESPLLKLAQEKQGGRSMVDEDSREAPVPRPFSMTARENFFADLSSMCPKREVELTPRKSRGMAPLAGPISLPFTAGSWTVYCNACDSPMADAHFHCDICEDDDFDLCESCFANGVFCPGKDHSLIKRFVKNGKVIVSTTERLLPRNMKVNEQPEPASQTAFESKDQAPDAKVEMPGAFETEADVASVETKVGAVDLPNTEQHWFRTCNCCVKGAHKN